MSDIYFPLDPTGKNPANKVPGEVHVLPNRPVRAIFPEYGAFYNATMTVVDNATKKPLKATQFRGAEMLAKESAKYGQKICTMVLITDPAVSNNVTITYQALGNWTRYSKKKLDVYIDGIQSNSGTVDKENILNFPKEWRPAPHLHHVSEVYGAEYLDSALGRVADAAAIGSAPNRNRVVQYLKDTAAQSTDAISSGTARMLAEHRANTNAHPQYAKITDLRFSAPLVKAPLPVSPAPAAKDVRLETEFKASEFYSLYGLNQNGGELHVSSKADFSDVVYRATDTGPRTTFKPTTLLPGSRTLYWRIRYRDEEGEWSSWSPTSTITTVPDYLPEGTFIRSYCAGVDLHWIVADGWGGERDILKQAKSTDCGYIPPLPPGTFIRQFCRGIEMWHVVADGNYGEKEVLFEAKSIECGYIPPEPEGTLKRYFCKGFDRWKEVADGNYGTYEVLVEVNSLECDYIPPPVAGTVLRTYCKGVDRWRVLADGKGGEIDVLYKANSEDCGYVPPPAEGTVLSRRCVGFTRYDTIADGKGGSYEVIGETNSPFCGYVAYPPKGEVIGYQCQGFDKYNKIADGNGGFTTELAERNSPICGWAPPPRGQFIREYCKGVDLWREYHNGSGGTYEELFAQNSTTCGYVPPPPPYVRKPYWRTEPGYRITDRFATTQFLLSYFETSTGGGTISGTEWMVTNSLGRTIYTGSHPGYELLPTVPSSVLTNHETYAIYGRFKESSMGWSAWSDPYEFAADWADPLPYGTFIRHFCSGTTLMAKRADGNYGEYDSIEAYKSTSCGYVDPWQGYLDTVPLRVSAYRANTSAQAVLGFRGDGTWYITKTGTGIGTGSGRYLPGNAADYEVHLWIDGMTEAYDGAGNAFVTGISEYAWQSFNNGFDCRAFISSALSQDSMGVYATFHISFRPRNEPENVRTISVYISAEQNCFALGTVIRTPDGDRTVESLAKDDIITSFQEPSMKKSNQFGWDTWSVNSLAEVFTQELTAVTGTEQFMHARSIKINGLHTTLTHRYFVFDGAQYCWKKAINITESDSLVDHELGLVPVTSIERVDEQTLFVAIDIDGTETLQVKMGDKYILSHNAC